MAILSEITAWMAVNGEGIYGTRPWKVCGERPQRAGHDQGYQRLQATSTHSGHIAGCHSNAGARDTGKPFTAQDVRFTSKGKMLYAFVMGWPEKEVIIGSLGTGSKPEAGKVQNVELLGFKGKVEWSQEATGLRVQMPAEKLSDYSIALKVALA